MGQRLWATALDLNLMQFLPKVWVLVNGRFIIIKLVTIINFTLIATDAKVSSSVWGTTDPTSTVFTFDDNRTQDFIAYCFKEVEGYSSFGSYTGATITLYIRSFIQASITWIMIKKTNGAKQWVIADTARDPSNVSDTVLVASNSSADWSNSENNFDILSNGFKLRATHDSKNGNGDSYVYFAFAEHPFKTSRGR